MVSFTYFIIVGGLFAHSPVTAAIALWNTAYRLYREGSASSARKGQTTDPELLKYLPDSAGSASTPPATTNGSATDSLRADSGRSALQPILSVLYCPFSDGTPSSNSNPSKAWVLSEFLGL